MKAFSIYGLPNYHLNPIAEPFCCLPFKTVYWMLTRRYDNGQPVTQSLNTPPLAMNKLNSRPIFIRPTWQSEIQIPIEKTYRLARDPNPAVSSIESYKTPAR